MSYEYGDVEAALCTILWVSDEDVASFRSKLKRFRDLGVPSAERPGTGGRTQYSQAHVMELAVACLLAGLGMSPKWLKQNVDFAITYLAKHKRSKSEEDLILLITPEGRTASTIFGLSNLKLFISSAKTDAYSILNVSSIQRKVSEQLSQLL